MLLSLTEQNNNKQKISSLKLLLSIWDSADSALMRLAEDTVDQKKKKTKKALLFPSMMYTHLFEMILFGFLREVETWSSNWVLQFEPV